MHVLTPIGIGELLDKLSILQVKSKQIKDSDKLVNIRKEMTALEAVSEGCEWGQEVVDLYQELCAVNTTLWLIEDQIRICERRNDFGATFVDLARQIYQQNDRRAAIKREINVLTGSDFIEEKGYTKY